MKSLFRYLRSDVSSGVVVFFVALPLCLGIALASGAPLFAGIIAGIVGGIVVGSLSGSALGVSGPAAGLAVIVFKSIEKLGTWEVFLLAVLIAGIIQFIMGLAKLGVIAYFFPSSVIKGMLTGIGLIIILKQVPHALGYNKDYEGNVGFKQLNDENTISALPGAVSDLLNLISPGALIITLVSLTILLFWEIVLIKKHKIFKVLQGPLVAVTAGVFFNYLFSLGSGDLRLGSDQVVSLPVADGFVDFFNQFMLPDFSRIADWEVYVTGFTIAIVASLETLLCVEATDKLDPEKRITSTNQELKAQGIGNIVSGFIGGLPITQVIVRSTANISFGARTKLSTIVHGILLLVCALLIPRILNMIPLATLACILIVVGCKLAKPSLFKEMYKLGWSQFIPFMVTVIGVVFTDLLQGIAIGMVVAIFYILRNNFRNPFYMIEYNHEKGREYNIILSEEVSFLNKGSILQMLNHVPVNARVVIDGRNSRVIDHDVVEIINNFKTRADVKNIELEVIGIDNKKLT
ncbi:SulP family inorganic anion transporter [Niastella caeni]|uniref:SulP family inorganic anion transporter n=1 Tax=Niastella caeni TaxID=2569763 RepID=A0A4S8HS09_9BACT|nr:SulP family inorganic anion transporter [Niastella caeni]THU38240.1 SulP family inorganic anion transporter [Niastella caeni]